MHIFDVNLIQITALLIINILGFLLGLVVILSNKNSKTNIFYFLTNISLIIWVDLGYLAYLPSLTNYSLVLMRFNHFFVGLAMVFVYAFVIQFPVESKWKIKDIIFMSAGTLLSILSIVTASIVADIDKVNGEMVWQMGSLINVFYIFVSLAALIGLYRIILKYHVADLEQKASIKAFIYGAILVTVLNLIFNVFLQTFFAIDKYNWVGDYSAIFFLGFTAYAIVKHHMFNIKVILTETAVIIVNVVLVIQIFIAQSWTERILNGIFFLVVLYGSWLLVKSVMREIEQRKELEKLTKQLEDANQHLQELDQMKTEFISIASHELLTPISAILGYLSMILDEKIVPVDNPKTKKFLDNIYASAKRLAKLVEDLLNVSRIEQGRIVVDRQAIDPVQAAKEVIAETMPKAKEAKLTLELEEPKETIPKVYADFDKVKEILVNIVGNALKFTKQGSVTISLTTSRDEDVWGKRGEGNYVVISVTDTGVGIPKEEQGNIFKKFSRAGRWATRDVQGTGLGLYVSKSLIEMLGGKIWVRSEVGKGSTFSISLSEVRSDDKREISGDVAKLGQPEQKELVDEGKVKHAKLKPTATPNDTSRKMKKILALSKDQVKQIQKMDIDKKQFDK